LGADIGSTDWYQEFNQTYSNSESAQMNLNSGIYDFSGKADFDYKPFDNHDVKFGANITHHTYKPTTLGIHLEEEESGQQGFNYDTVTNDSRIRALETDLYVEDNWDISNYFKLNFGLHYSTFTVDKKTYHSVQPRVSLRSLITENLSLKAGYAYMSQYIHLLSSNAISLPTDLWVPVTGEIVPMNSHQVALGAFYEWNGYEFSVEGYYKKMNNVLEYKDGASFFSIDETDWQDKVVIGDGWAYGIPFAGAPRNEPSDVEEEILRDSGAHGDAQGNRRRDDDQRVARPRPGGRLREPGSARHVRLRRDRLRGEGDGRSHVVVRS
jgi:hypothetical protein